MTSDYSPDRYMQRDLHLKEKEKMSSKKSTKERAVDEDEDDVGNTKDSVLKKYIDRFRYCEPESRSDRRPADATEFWWKQVRSSIDSINEQIEECTRKREEMKRRVKAPIPKPDFSPPRHVDNFRHATRLQPLEKSSIEDLQSRADEILEKNTKKIELTTDRIKDEDLALLNANTERSFKDNSHFISEKQPIVKVSRCESSELTSHQKNPPDSNDILTQWRLRRKMELARMHQDPLSKASSFHKVDAQNKLVNSQIVKPQKKNEGSFCTESCFHTDPISTSVTRMVDAQTQASPKLHAGQISFTASRENRCLSERKSGSESYLVTSIDDIECINPNRRRKFKRTQKKKVSDKDHRVYNATTEEGNPRRLVKHMDRDTWSADRGRSGDVHSSTDFGSLSVSARESRELKTPIRGTISQAIGSHLFGSGNLRSSADSDSFFGCQADRRFVDSVSFRGDELQLTDVSEAASKSKSSRKSNHSQNRENQRNNHSQSLHHSESSPERLDTQPAKQMSAECPVAEADKTSEQQQNELDEAILKELMSCDSDDDFQEDSVLKDLRQRRQACIDNIGCLDTLIQSRQGH